MHTNNNPGEMQVRIIRRIPMTEVTERIAVLQKKYGGRLDDVSYHFAEADMEGEAFDEYVEWMGMEHALGAYGEGEEFDYIAEEEREIGEAELSKLTPKRLELLDHMSKHRTDSINELASMIGRDVKNVYLDLKALENLGFIDLIREGRRLVPDLLVREITFLTW